MSKRFTYFNSFASVTYLLDLYGGASVAYSLRNLLVSTTNVIRVRRDSDNSEQDFTSADITDGTLITWTGSSSGFVTIWYDQSGNDNHAKQSTASRQAKIVDAGTLILDNGNPAIEWNVNDAESLDFTTGLTDNRAVFQVLNAVTIPGGNNQFLLGDSSSYNYHSSVHGKLLSSNYAASYVKNGNNYINLTLTNFTNTQRPVTQSLITMLHTSSSGKASSLSEDRVYSNRSWIGKMQEVIIYPTDETSNRLGIAENINNHYSIY